MASPTLESLFIDSDSNSDTQSELSELDSELLEDLTANDDSDASSSTRSSTESSSQSLDQPSKKRRVRAVNTWALARKPTANEPHTNSSGRRY